MKKLFVSIALVIGMAASAFALDISAGFSANMGGNVGNDYSGYNGLVTGGGAYINLDLFAGLGFQGEINFVNNQFNISGNTVSFTEYESVDFAFMPWYQLNFFFGSIGAGVGLNFAYYDEDFGNFTIDTDMFVPGLALGSSFKIYLSNHFGINFGVHSVLDFFPIIDKTVSGRTTSYTIENSEFVRKSIYGSLGIDFRF